MLSHTMKQQGQRYAEQREASEQSKIIGVSEERCLPLHALIKCSQSLLAGGVAIHPFHGQLRLQAMERFSYAGTPCCDVGCEITLMFLRAAHQKGRNACDTNAAPDVSHQVIDSGCIADLLFAQRAHGVVVRGTKM